VGTKFRRNLIIVVSVKSFSCFKFAIGCDFIKGFRFSMSGGECKDVNGTAANLLGNPQVVNVVSQYLTDAIDNGKRSELI